jgi:hypothetical protein
MMDTGASADTTSVSSGSPQTSLAQETWHSRYPQSNGIGDFTHKVPIEILLKIFQLVASPRTREGLRSLLELTHVCRFWRAALINQPHMWSTVFATKKDRRGFVEMCLERSQTVDLDVTMDASEWGWAHPGCTCDKDERRVLLPNENIPCEWHFIFEPLATLEHSKRIRTLDIDFRGTYHPIPLVKRREFALEGCRFFSSSFPQLTSLTWNHAGRIYAKHIFSSSPFTPTLSSLSLGGALDGSFTQVNNLTSLTFVNYEIFGPRVESFRLFMLNNQSLESLSLDVLIFEGDSKGPSVDLPNLKSFEVHSHHQILSTIIRVPALQRLSSLRISLDSDGGLVLDATGDTIALSVETVLPDAAEVWQGLTGYIRPTIRHVRLYDYPEGDRDYSGGGDGRAIISLLADAYVLEVGHGYLPFLYPGFSDNLKQLGPQLRTIRFEVWEMEPFRESGDEYELWGGSHLDQIEDLVKHRFAQGRPFSTVERMVVSESETSNRLQDHVWRRFYDGRNLGQYVRLV